MKNTLEQPNTHPFVETVTTASCPTCAGKIPEWWVRGYCATCGGDLPQTRQQIELERLRDALTEIDNVTGFDYPTMPEAGRAEAHKLVREVVMLEESMRFHPTRTTPPPHEFVAGMKL